MDLRRWPGTMSISSKSAPDLLTRAAPPLFVVLWSTGFIGAKLGLPQAPPFTFLLLRFLIVTSTLAILAIATSAPWPRSPRAIGRIAIAGALIHGTYLGGVFLAISLGVPAGITALIVGMQPLVTALASGPYLGERLNRRQWIGLLLGFAGLILVVLDKLAFRAGDVYGVCAALVALAGITVGTLYQKRHATGMNIFSGSCVQFIASGLVLLPLALLFERGSVTWNGEFVFALLWLSFVLSIGAISLFHLMIRRGAAARVVSLFYMTPAVTALFAWLLFNETLPWPALVGMALTAAGVALVTRG